MLRIAVLGCGRIGRMHADNIIDRYAEAFAAEIGAFVDAIETATAPEVGFEDGRRALLLAEAAVQSAAQGRTVRTSEIG